MKTISRYIMTLALLITAVTGAWAQATFEVKEITADMVPAAWEGDNTIVSPEDLATLGITFFEVTKAQASAWADYPKEGTVRLLYAYSTGFSSVDWAEGTPDGDSWNFKRNQIYVANATGYRYFVTVPPAAPEPAIGVTTNAASEQDLFTEASFTMPAFDATAEYELVRDMQDEANPVAFSGLPTNDEPIIVKKGDDGKYQPIEALTIQLNDELISGDDKNIIDADGLTVTVEKKNANNNFENFGTLADFLADMQPGTYKLKATPTNETSPYDGTVYSSEFTVVEQYDLTVKPADDYSKGKVESVTVGGTTATPDEKGKVTGIAPDTEVKIKAKHGYIIEKVEAKKTVITMLNAATTENIGMVVCNKGHLHDAKTAVPAGCTAVGILGKVTETGHGLILALQNANSQNWNTINGWTSASYAGTTLKVLTDNARGTNLTSYTTLGETTVSNWAVAQKDDYVAIFTNLGSTTGDNDGHTYDSNVNDYITTGVGGTAMSGNYFSATGYSGDFVWHITSEKWGLTVPSFTRNVRPVLGF